MSDMFTHVTMCDRNHLPPLLSVVSFVTACLGFLIEAQEPVTDASQDCNFKLLNSTVLERTLLFERLSQAGSDKLNIIYHLGLCRYSLNVLILDLC